jgi:hypothetical protein
MTIPLLAHMALVRFLVRVHTHVGFQSTRFTKTFLAHITFERLSRSCEYACGLSKNQIDENASRTHRIRTVSRSCEYARGLFKLPDVRKTLLAHITFIRSLFRVNTHVVYQSIRMTKSFIAHIALVRFLVRVEYARVWSNGWSNKHLPANIALVPSLSSSFLS